MRILVIDDNVLMRDTMAMMFRSKSAVADVEVCGHDGEGKGDYDLVVLNYHPSLRKHIIRLAGAGHKKHQIVIVSTDDQHKESVQKAGFRFMCKPLSLQDISTMLALSVSGAGA